MLETVFACLVVIGLMILTIVQQLCGLLGLVFIAVSNRINIITQSDPKVGRVVELREERVSVLVIEGVA